MFFNVRDENSAEIVARRLRAGGARANELLPVMIRIAQNMFQNEEALFRSGGRRGGGSWKRLKDETVKRKGSSVILVETGELKASLTVPNHENNILEVTNDSILFGTSNPLGDYHSRGAGGLPVRPVIKIAWYDLKRWDKWISEFLVSGR